MDVFNEEIVKLSNSFGKDSSTAIRISSFSLKSCLSVITVLGLSVTGGLNHIEQFIILLMAIHTV